MVCTQRVPRRLAAKCVKERLLFQGAVIRKTVHGDYIGLIVRCATSGPEESRDFVIFQKVQVRHQAAFVAEVGDILHFSLQGSEYGNFKVDAKVSDACQS